MTAPAARAARLFAAVTAVVLPPVAYHLLIVAQGASTLVVALGWLAAVACIMAATRIAGMGVLGIVTTLAAVATFWVATRDARFGVYVGPIASWLVLMLIFARTLRRGRVPLVTAIARLCHDELPEAVARYTRGVTLAWSLFFAAVAAGLTIAAIALPLETWSLAANVASLPLVALFFAAEYAIRVRRFPDLEHVDPVAMAARLGRAGWSLASGK
jgi:uncharacterized membrane protein